MARAGEAHDLARLVNAEHTILSVKETRAVLIIPRVGDVSKP
jgi:hypothetical protein